MSNRGGNDKQQGGDLTGVDDLVKTVQSAAASGMAFAKEAARDAGEALKDAAEAVGLPYGQESVDNAAADARGEARKQPAQSMTAQKAADIASHPVEDVPDVALEDKIEGKKRDRGLKTAEQVPPAAQEGGPKRGQLEPAVDDRDLLAAELARGAKMGGREDPIAQLGEPKQPARLPDEGKSESERMQLPEHLDREATPAAADAPEQLGDNKGKASFKDVASQNMPREGNLAAVRAAAKPVGTGGIISSGNMPNAADMPDRSLPGIMEPPQGVPAVAAEGLRVFANEVPVEGEMDSGSKLGARGATRLEGSRGFNEYQHDPGAYLSQAPGVPAKRQSGQGSK